VRGVAAKEAQARAKCAQRTLEAALLSSSGPSSELSGAGWLETSDVFGPSAQLPPAPPCTQEGGGGNGSSGDMETGGGGGSSGLPSMHCHNHSGVVAAPRRHSGKIFADVGAVVADEEFMLPMGAPGLRSWVP
jgi:hypothetical protein